MPILGTGLAIASGAADYATGTPLEQAAAETGANIAGGASGGVAGAEIGGMIGTSYVPVWARPLGVCWVGSSAA